MLPDLIYHGRTIVDICPTNVTIVEEMRRHILPGAAAQVQYTQCTNPSPSVLGCGPECETRPDSPKHDLAGLRCSQDVVCRVPDSSQLDDPVLGRQPGRGAEPVDMPVVVDATLKPVGALGHGGGADLKQKRSAVAVFRAEHNSDVTCEIALKALLWTAVDVGGRCLETIAPSIDTCPIGYSHWTFMVEIQICGWIGNYKAH